MTSQELRQRFINFFKNHPALPHQEIPSASLVPSEEEQLVGKEKVLFTSAGMQPLIPYLTGQKEPPSKRLVNVQKCLRTDDIEEVGDEVHHTFFEMLGNWSIGDYWKEEAIKLSFEFLTKELEIPVEKLAVTVFAGDEDAPKDEESAGVWKSLGMPEERIFYFGKSHNWWPTARGEQDSGEYKNPLGPCGPDTEMFYWIGEGQSEGKPNEDSRWVEIWNDVFMQFNRKEDGTLEDLPQRNVDTGMGLERTLAVLNGRNDDYETELFLPLIKKLEELSGKKYDERKREFRVITDHIKAACFLSAEGISTSSKDQRGAVLRRLIDIAFEKGRLLELDKSFLPLIGDIVVEIYGHTYPELNINKAKIDETLSYVGEKIEQIRARPPKGATDLQNLNLQTPEQIKSKEDSYLGKYYSGGAISTDEFLRQHNFGSLASVYAGTVAFDAKTTSGYPVSDTREIVEGSLGSQFNPDEFEKTYQILTQEHQQKSRIGGEQLFKGGLADQSEIVTKYHTVTHLLHQALRDVLGSEVFQKGSNITSERLRFDFSFDRKMTDEEIKQVEDLVNEKIEEDLKVDRKIVNPGEAKKIGAIGLFDEKYGTEASIYGIGPGSSLDSKAKDQRDRGGYYSLEFCGGPHVEHTGVIGKIKITKEEAVSAGIRRIRAQVA